jgi:hypothetical protein
VLVFGYRNFLGGPGVAAPWLQHINNRGDTTQEDLTGGGMAASDTSHETSTATDAAC